MDRTLREIFLFSFIFSLSSGGAGTSIPFFIVFHLSLAHAHQGMDRHLPQLEWTVNWLALLVGAMMVATAMLKRPFAASEHTTVNDPVHAILHQAALESAHAEVEPTQDASTLSSSIQVAVALPLHPHITSLVTSLVTSIGVSNALLA
jgi:hypothetical protein